MILFKWVTPIDSAPSIINSLICMAMRQKDTAPLFEGSAGVESILMLLTVLSVPIMLNPKPVILYMQNKNKKPEEHVELHDDEEGGGHGHGGEFNMGEIAIH